VCSPLLSDEQEEAVQCEDSNEPALADRVGEERAQPQRPTGVAPIDQ
jgi:hypothetical protein